MKRLLITLALALLAAIAELGGKTALGLALVLRFNVAEAHFTA